MAKFAKLPYQVSESHRTVIFELIHIDIWGPYKVPTNGKFRYFLTVVDDCSRSTWIYLLEQKSDSFAALKSFLSFVSTQFEKQVKIVRSDNALEFIKGQCGPYLQSKGIVHQTSCVDRPQQNGRVERKHRHILDTARALRFHAKLPLKFWGDCVTTATYLINRVPSTVLQNKTPYEVLLKKKPVYDHLRVFGCFVVASNPSRTADKFDPRGVPCVFLAYPSNQKGYKFYNLLTHSTFVSRDDVFHENIFPYAAKSITQFLNPLPTTLPCQFESSAITEEYDTSVPASTPNNTSTSVPVSETFVQSQTTNETSLSTSQPQIQTRKSTRTVNLLSKLKDFVLTHTPRANQVSQTLLVIDFQAFCLCINGSKGSSEF